MKKIFDISKVMTENKIVEPIINLEKKKSEIDSRSFFLSNISHEIRTPLTVISGFADLAINECGDDSQLNFLKIIKKNSDHLHSLVDKFLELSRVESQSFVEDQGHFSFFDFIDKITSLIGPQVKEKGLELKVNYNGFIPEFIFADLEKTKKVFIGLLESAVKYTDSGVIHLNIKFKVSDAEDRAVLMASAVNSESAINLNILEPAPHQSENDDVGKLLSDESLDVGLMLSKKIAQSLGGDIQLACHPTGVGTIIEVKLEVRLCESVLYEETLTYK